MSPKDATIVEVPNKMVLWNPGPTLSVLGGSPGKTLSLVNCQVAQVWGLVGIAAIGRQNSAENARIDLDPGSPSSNFARALGIDDAMSGREADDWGERGRTVKIRRITDMLSVEPVADRISRLISPSDHVAQATLYYVIVELLRNVVQHSQDPLGGIVAAQAMTRGPEYDRPAVQVAVADNGIGIPAHLSSRHPGVTDPAAAIEKALRAHISGTFAEGLSGSEFNAGFGLFAIQELTKLTGGRLLVASRGAALSIQGDRTDPIKHHAKVVAPGGTGFPGTLVAFELPLEGGLEFSALMEEVRKRAKTQAPARAVHRWINYGAPPAGARRILVKLSRENTEQAASVSKGIKASLLAGDPIVLDFAEISFVTQSFLHALLFTPLRIAWAERQPVYVLNAAPAVRSSLEMLEEYALGG